MLGEGRAFSSLYLPSGPRWMVGSIGVVALDVGGDGWFKVAVLVGEAKAFGAKYLPSGPLWMTGSGAVEPVAVAIAPTCPSTLKLFFRESVGLLPSIIYRPSSPR